MDPILSPYAQPGPYPTSAHTYSSTERLGEPKPYYLQFRDGEDPHPALITIPYARIPESSRIVRKRAGRYILLPMRYFRLPWHGHVTGYCDHVKCQDPRCIESQFRENGFRDDLRHHGDQDRNGNMRDGDNVGEHCDEEEDEDDDNDPGLHGIERRINSQGSALSVPYDELIRAQMRLYDATR